MKGHLVQYEYKFVKQGMGGSGSIHCTYCPKPPGQACGLNCVDDVYAKIQKEREADGVIVNDTPAQD